MANSKETSTGSETNKEPEELETIWEVPDELWMRIGPVIDEMDPPKHMGRHRVDPREVLNTIIYRLRTGCQWNHLPQELVDDSSAHRTFQRWEQLGVFDRIWAVLIEECEELGGVDWSWQAADGCMNKAQKGGTVSAPTRRIELNQARNAA